MLWRKFKLDWRYALGELIIVTAGVMIALWAQQWNEQRQDRIDERRILDRLLIDLDVDRTRLTDMLESVQEKEQSLDRLRRTFESGSRPVDATQFLEDVVVGANYGWNQAEARDTTYAEVLASGRFGLVRNADLRSAIAEYYNSFRVLYVRSDARETEFPHISYQLMPRSRDSDRVGILLSPVTELTDAEIESLVDSVLASSLRDYVLAETNLARFILRMTIDMQAKHAALLDVIAAYRNSEIE